MPLVENVAGAERELTAAEAELARAARDYEAAQRALAVARAACQARLERHVTQRLKNEYIYGYASAGGDVAERASILGALSLYLNFINLFTLLLQLLGQRD